MVALCLALAAPSPLRAAPALSEEDLALLAAGGAVVHVGEDASGEADAAIEAAIDIAAPPSRVFAVMTDCARAPRYVEGLISCRVLQRSADGLSDIREHHSRYLAFLPDMISIFRSTYIPNHEIRFERVGGDLKFLKGVWTLEAKNGGRATRVGYEVRVSASVSAPGFLIRAALEETMPNILGALRREVLSGK